MAIFSLSFAFVWHAMSNEEVDFRFIAEVECEDARIGVAHVLDEPFVHLGRDAFQPLLIGDFKIFRGVLFGLEIMKCFRFESECDRVHAPQTHPVREQDGQRQIGRG